ncbi:MAG: hypothetical protein U1E92_03235 [Moraxella osloensis]
MEQTKGVMSQAIEQAVKDSQLTKNLPPLKNSKSKMLSVNLCRNRFDLQTNRKYVSNLSMLLSKPQKPLIATEVNSMIEFYGSNIGQSVIAKQSQFGKAYLEKTSAGCYEKSATNFARTHASI